MDCGPGLGSSRHTSRVSSLLGVEPCQSYPAAEWIQRIRSVPCSAVQMFVTLHGTDLLDQAFNQLYTVNAALTQSIGQSLMQWLSYAICSLQFDRIPHQSLCFCDHLPCNSHSVLGCNSLLCGVKEGQEWDCSVDTAAQKHNCPQEKYYPPENHTPPIPDTHNLQHLSVRHQSLLSCCSYLLDRESSGSDTTGAKKIHYRWLFKISTKFKHTDSQLHWY